MKLYKREGRKFVPMQIEDRTGMFYQKDYTFTHHKDENTIGVCILSTIDHEVVMSLCDAGNRLFTRIGALKTQGIIPFDEIPTTSEMFIALHEYRESLDIETSHPYWCKNDRFCNENMFTAYAGRDGFACFNPASYTYSVGSLRLVKRFKRFLVPF